MDLQTVEHKKVEKAVKNHGNFFTSGSKENSAKCGYTCNKMHQLDYHISKIN